MPPSLDMTEESFSSLPQLSSGPVGSYSRGRWVGLGDQVRRRRKREADVAGCQGRWLWREVCGHQGLENEDGEQRSKGMTLQEAEAGRGQHKRLRFHLCTGEDVGVLRIQP